MLLYASSAAMAVADELLSSEKARRLMGVSLRVIK
jgi:hypothetical protein